MTHIIHSSSVPHLWKLIIIIITEDLKWKKGLDFPQKNDHVAMKADGASSVRLLNQSMSAQVTQSSHSAPSFCYAGHMHLGM